MIFTITKLKTLIIYTLLCISVGFTGGVFVQQHWGIAQTVYEQEFKQNKIKNKGSGDQTNIFDRIFGENDDKKPE